MGAKREYIGSIWTDVAALILGDPCRIIRDDRRPDGTIEYGDYVAMKCDRNRDPQDPLKIEKHSIVVPTVEGCDGWCKVYVERGKDGWPLRLIVDLDAKVMEDPENKEKP